MIFLLLKKKLKDEVRNYERNKCKCAVVDGYLENFQVIEVRFGSDLL